MKTGKIKTEIVDGVPTVNPEHVLTAQDTMILDVRRPEEFTGELGHIKGAQLVTLGPELEKFLEKVAPESSIIFVCRSGGRSAHATQYSLQKGFKHTANMKGGMLLWNHLKMPVEI
jgi:rhodanese-related sulfurtransferase